MEQKTNNSEVLRSVDTSQRDKQKKYLIVMAAGFIVLIIGITLFNLGFFSEEKEVIESGNAVDNLAPPEARTKAMSEGKYGTNLSNPYSATSEIDDENITTLSGRKLSYGQQSNEGLTDSDFLAVEKAATGNGSTNTTGKKGRINKQTQRRIKSVASTNRYYADPNTALVRKSAEELRQEKIEREERERNTRTADLILDQMENANKQRNNTTALNPSQPETQRDPYAVKPMAAIEKPANSNVNTLKRQVNKSTIGNAFNRSGFYSESNLNNQVNSQNTGVNAVVHGQGDGVKVGNGSAIKLRILDDTYFIVDNQRMLIPRNTLIYGICSIGQDRLQIQVQSVRRGNDVYAVQMVAFDLDGQQGLYIPNLSEKNLLARQLVQTGSRPLQGGTFFNAGQTVGQQVGQQVAMQATRSAMQGVTNFARSKLQSPKVSVRPNYKILLMSGSLQSTDMENTIDNY